MNVYTVRACKYGSVEMHSYIVGVYSTEDAALEASDLEEAYRDMEYSCEVIEWILDRGAEGGGEDWGVTILNPSTAQYELDL